MSTRTLSFVLVASISSAAFGSAFSNGSFESPVLGGSVILSDGTALGAWHVAIPSGSAMELIRGTNVGLAPYDASQFVSFNGGNHAPGGSVYQDFDTQAGATYMVSFATGRVASGGGVVGVNGQVFGDPLGANVSLGTLDGFALGSQGQWTPHSFQFRASAGSARLQFSDISTATVNVDVGLDGVEIVLVSPPCLADFDHSGVVSVLDIYIFLSSWFSGSPTADVDGIPGLQVSDIFAFLNIWFAGCP